MFEKTNEEIETIVGPSVSLKGNLKSDGNIKLKGKVSGDIKTKSDVFIDEGAEIKASVTAKNVKVAGTVTGDINASGEVQILESGRVFGNVASGALIVNMGAMFNGKSSMEQEINNSKEGKEEKEIEPEVEVEQ